MCVQSGVVFVGYFKPGVARESMAGHVLGDRMPGGEGIWRWSGDRAAYIRVG
jgi:hypothetical protein